MRSSWLRSTYVALITTVIKCKNVPLIRVHTRISILLFVYPCHIICKIIINKKKLQSVYKQLYPRHDLKPVSRFCHKFGDITIADLIGSDMPGPNSRSSSVIMAFWPSKGTPSITLITVKYKWELCSFLMRHMLSYSNGGDL